MPSVIGRIAEKGSGARLSGKLYREWHAKVKRHDLLEKALQLHLDFLNSLPEGWLAHTFGDVGLLNDAYIASEKAGMDTRKKKK